MPNPNLPIAGDYNVYVGARYVPLIMGVWSATTAYEPLSVVMFEGNSYTSRTFVPAGVPVTNETYWAATGNYNGQVEQYRQEVVELAKQIVSPARPNLNNRYFLFVGDSYMAPSYNYALLACQNLEIPSDHYYINGVSGAGIVDTTNNTSVISIIRNWVANNPAVVPLITDIFICTGYNDSTQSITKPMIQNSLNTLCDYLDTTFPNTQKNLGMVGFTNSSLTQLVNVSLWYQETWCQHGFNFLSRMSNCLSIYGNLQADKIHPTENGQNWLSRYLTQAILGKPFSFVNYTSIPLSNFSPNTGVTLGEWYLGLYVQEGGAQVQLSCSLNISNLSFTGNQITLGTINNIFGFQDFWLPGQTRIGMNVSSTRNEDLEPLIEDSQGNYPTVNEVVPRAQTIEGNSGYLKLNNNQMIIYYTPIGDINRPFNVNARCSGYYNYFPI